MICKIQNLTEEVRPLHFHEFQPGQILDISDVVTQWFVDDVVAAISSGEFGVHNESGLISGTVNQINFIAGKTPVKITADEPLETRQVVENNKTLRPYDMIHEHIDASKQVFPISITGKVGDVYTYAIDPELEIDPAYYDCIFQKHSTIRDGVYEVDTENKTIICFKGNLLVGEPAWLSKPVVMEIFFPQEFPLNYLYGGYFSAKRYGDDDSVRLQLVDKLGAGVALDWYEQWMFDYLGEYVYAEYDEAFIEHLDKLCYLKTPDRPGDVPGGTFARILYYCKDPTKTDIDFKADLISEIDC